MRDIRIQKYLSDSGIASRRNAEKMVEAGLVRINDRLAQIGDKIDPDNDAVFVDGELVVPKENSHYYMLYKPRGYTTTMQDEMGRKCIRDLIGDIPGRVYPVGRLDKDSEGLLLLTDDGEFANRMMHPSSHIEKTYRVTVHPSVSEEQLAKLGSGMEIDGRKTAPAVVTVLQKEPGRVVLQITIYEGRNRQIRKMCEQLGLEVARLKRTSVGSVKLGMLSPGSWRELTDAEIRALRGRRRDVLNEERVSREPVRKTNTPGRERKSDCRRTNNGHRRNK